MSIAHTHRTGRARRGWIALAVSALAAVTLTACADSTPSNQGGGGSGAGTASFPSVAQNPDSPITVWVDATRQPMAEAYKKANPNVSLDIVTYDGSAAGSRSLQTKIELFNQAGKGWPDVAFSATLDDTVWATDPSNGYAAPLTPDLVPQQTIDGFATGAMSSCTVDGVVHCLRNDLAQDVLWYNQPLMQEFGYDVPTTWEEYQALGEKVAQEHPGYVIGSVGDGATPEIYYQASQCPINEVTGSNQVTINPSSPNCTRMTSLLDTLIKNKSITTESVFGPSYVTNVAPKTLMLVGPSWFGQFIFNASFKAPAGTIAAAAPLKWASDAKAYTGNYGGGVWLVSQHSENRQAAADFITAMTTGNDYQVTAPTYPAYKPAAQQWLAAQQKEGYFASDVSTVFQTAADQVWDGWSPAKYSIDSIWSANVVPSLVAGDSLNDTWPSFTETLSNTAKAAGYEVAN